MSLPTRTSLITYPDGVYAVGYSYDEIGRMLQVQETNPYVTNFPIATYSYDALSRRTNLAYANGTAASYSYDPASGLTSIVQTFQSPSPGVTFGYGRDALERNVGESVSQPGYLWHPPGAGTTSYTPNTLNQYTAISGNPLGYDGNGNLNSDPTAPLGASSYVWDLKNRLVSATNAQHSTTYTYDAFSRRSSKTVDGVTTVFVWDGSNLIATYNGSGTKLSHRLQCYCHMAARSI